MEKPPDRVPHAVADALPIGSPRSPARLLIRVSTGSGTGPTRLAAFDAALVDAGLSGYNLVRLSSVIPPRAAVHEVSRSDQVRGTTGDIAYCVYAAAYASTPGEQAWAGIAWAVHEDQSGVGIFVEQSASSQSMVLHDLTVTVEAMSATRGNRYRLVGQRIRSAVCADHPVCAIVVAAYGTSGWSHLTQLGGIGHV